MSVPLNTTQYWDVINLTPDAVPVHLHNTAFRVSKNSSSSRSQITTAIVG
jgi:FtsP/CotA-like multicopper oxidase with cupredoxin domain